MKIVFLDQYTINESDLSAIKALGDYTGYDSTNSEDIIERCKEAEIVITNKTPFKAETIAALPNLKLICIAATGMNNVDLDAAQEAGVEVRNAKDYSTFSVAEHTLCGVLALSKQLLYLDDFVKSGRYSSSDKLFNYDRHTFEINGKNWGIIGLGNIGKRVACLAQTFGCNVAYYSTSGNNSCDEYERKSLEELLMWSDILSLHAPLSRNTYHMLKYEQFKLMKPNAIIANVARGSLINEADLAKALNQELIAGAALDVYSAEPMKHDNPLMQVEDKYKLVLTPHSAWSTKEALQSVVDKVAENIKDYLKNRKVL